VQAPEQEFGDGVVVVWQDPCTKHGVQYSAQSSGPGRLGGRQWQPATSVQAPGFCRSQPNSGTHSQWQEPPQGAGVVVVKGTQLVVTSTQELPMHETPLP
jgi:hypothetical protein